MDGIICVYKPTGFTSFDVIAIMRRLLNTKKIGHSGTLDPLAEGVLPVFAGAATKAIDYCPDTDKEYRAAFKIGLTTDTQDITGEVLTKANNDDLAERVTREIIQEKLNKYIGEINQIPPMYSAVKVNGKRLYDMARKGVTVERSPRKITIRSIELEQYDNLEGIIKISCSKGTYVRTLIHDIGQDLGFGAVMTALQRTKSNGFDLNDCYTLESLREACSENPESLSRLLKPLDSLFNYPKAYMNEKQTALFRNGAELKADSIKPSRGGNDYKGIYSLCDTTGRIVALAKMSRKNTFSIMQRFNYG